ncbi:RNA polymerase sigma factor [Caloramator sp. E03]|uniref:RNA polymerase sigma factor n=1 Tax=Caloramator sp. E03 TaxID=2576307 RepID=UPI001FA98D34|nr:RNA polymerase sigma factor [Caloramator sp. E03]
MIKLNEKELIEGLKSGDEKAFIEVVELYKKKIISLCYTYTNEYQEAEDISQEVFITLYKSIKSFRGDCSLSTYIYKITVSRCLDYKRKKSIKNFLTGFIGYKSDDYRDLDEKNYIRQCILSLPEDLKITVILYYYIGLSQKEIADILGITQKNVEGRIYRARQKLKIELEKGGEILCSKNGMI